jgi:hypothetical protein
MNMATIDVAAVVGLLVMGAVAGASVAVGGEGGLQVASAAVGGIAGWLARSGGKTANVTAETATVQADAEGRS